MGSYVRILQLLIPILMSYIRIIQSSSNAKQLFFIHFPIYFITIAAVGRYMVPIY